MIIEIILIFLLYCIIGFLAIVGVSKFIVKLEGIQESEFFANPTFGEEVFILFLIVVWPIAILMRLYFLEQEHMFFINLLKKMVFGGKKHHDKSTL